MKGHIYRRCPRPPSKACSSGRCEHRWAYTFSAGTDPDTGKRRQFTGSGYTTRKTAEQECRKAIAQAETGELKLRREARRDVQAAARQAELRPTVAAFLAGWLERGVGSQGARWRPNTRDGYASHVRLYVNPSIGHLRMAEVTAGDLQGVLDGIATTSGKTGQQRTRQTVARVRATITGAWKDAARRGLIDRNVAADLQVIGAESRHEIVFYTPEQLATFLAACEPDRLGPMYQTIAFTGLRRGEAAGLQWGTAPNCPECGAAASSVDLDAAVMVVRHTLTQRGGQLRHGQPKTKRSERVVALDAGTVEVLRRLRKAQAAERLAFGPAYRSGDYVFAREDGTPYLPDYITHRFEEIAQSVGLPKAGPHALRHSHASHALAAGVATKVVSDRLGHSSTTITENIYQHVSSKVAADAAELIAALTRAAASKSASNGDQA